MLAEEDMEELSLRRIDDCLVGVSMVDMARLRGEGMPRIVIFLLSRLPNLRKMPKY